MLLKKLFSTVKNIVKWAFATEALGSALEHRTLEARELTRLYFELCTALAKGVDKILNASLKRELTELEIEVYNYLTEEFVRLSNEYAEFYMNQHNKLGLSGKEVMEDTLRDIRKATWELRQADKHIKPRTDYTREDLN